VRRISQITELKATARNGMVWPRWHSVLPRPPRSIPG